MIPYFEHPVWHLGPLTIQAFGIAVAISMWFGLSAVQKRIESVGLDTKLGNPLGVWMIVFGILGAHLFAVLLYFPHALRDDPLFQSPETTNRILFDRVCSVVPAGTLLFRHVARG